MSARAWSVATTGATSCMYEVHFTFYPLPEPEAWRAVATLAIRLSASIAELLATGAVAPEVAARMARRLFAHTRMVSDIHVLWPSEGGNERVLAALFLALEAEDEP